VSLSASPPKKGPRWPAVAGLAVAGLLSLSFAQSVEAAEQPDTSRGERALLTGLSIAGSSFAAGGWLLAGTQDLRRINAGLAVIGGGLTLAPLFAHGIEGEWGRGAWFALPPALAGAGMVALLAVVPRAPVRGRASTHTVVLFPAVLSLELLGSGVGIVDAALVDERQRLPVSLRGLGSRDYAGIEMGGQW